MWVSWAWKWTVLNSLREEKNNNIQFLKSYVTRRMRPWEVNGDLYWFIDNKEFEKWIENNDFLEYEINHKVAYYGTKKSEVEEWLSKNLILIKEIDTKGLIQLKAKHPDFKACYTSIFLDAPNEVLRTRFFERNPGWKEIDLENRMESTSFERKQAEQYCDYIIDWSQSKKKVLAEIKKIIGL